VTAPIDRTGHTYGCRRVLGKSDQSVTEPDGRVIVKWRCECLTCGAIGHLRADSLIHNDRTGVDVCKSCMITRPDRAPSAGKHCRVCYDMPHRRPVVGACACGGRFETEVFGPAEMYRGYSRIADCAGVM
jgi:hypothetical protein